MIRRRHVVYAVALLVLSTLAYYFLGDRRLDWKEEVQLSSGEVIWVHRTARLSANHIPGGGGGSFIREMTLEIERPRRPDAPGRWSAHFYPLLFDRDPASGEWFVVATFHHCDGWYELGRPKLPYTEFRFRQGQWMQQPLTAELIGRQANLLIDERSDGKTDTSLAWKAKLLQMYPIAPKYRRIVDKWTTGC